MFEPRRNINALAINVTLIIDNDIAKVQSDTQLKRAASGCKVILNFNCALQGGHRTGKLGEHAVSCRLDQAALMARQSGLDDLVPKPTNLCIGGLFCAFHHGGIADNVGCQDRR